MNTQRETHRRPSGEFLHRNFVSSVCFVLAAGGGLAVIGWLFHIPALISIVPGLATMKFNTAACFIFAALSLWYLHEGFTRRKAGLALAGGVVLISGLTLLEYWVGWNLRLDELLIHDGYTNPSAAAPGRMSLATSQCFLFFGIALLMLDLE